MRKYVASLLATLMILVATPLHAATRDYIIGGDRPVVVHLPSNSAQISKQRPAPLLIMLHSYSTSGEHQERYMKFAPIARTQGLIYIAPNGSKNSKGDRFWNATPACCDVENSKVDDVDYILSLINQINRKTPVDFRRIYLVGHSNGGFLALKIACEHSAKIAAVVNFSGSMNPDGQGCAPTTPVALLQVHGSQDLTIKNIDSTLNSQPYAGDEAILKFWAVNNNCENPLFPPARLAQIDIERTIAKKETSVSGFKCPSAPVEYWKIVGAGHSPKLQPDFAQRVIDFLIKIKR